MDSSKQLVDKIVEAIQDKKGSRIVVADLDGIDGAICRYFVVCQGNSPMQVEAITDSVADKAREDLGEKPTHVVGLENAVWVAMDYVDVMVHIFVPEMREYYSIETLWEDAKITEIPDLE
ncbi:MAG: ribosome silencing factor [Prevotella sp.]|jgi:ribosome-associated protein|nr:ribosome silencing factor [Prevotella sp.]MBR1622053.1 ribosome silencing factor [Prevotella sp.]